MSLRVDCPITSSKRGIVILAVPLAVAPNLTQYQTQCGATLNSFRSVPGNTRLLRIIWLGLQLRTDSSIISRRKRNLALPGLITTFLYEDRVWSWRRPDQVGSRS